MPTPAQRFRDALAAWFLPGAIYTFVGAGGKTTAMNRVAAYLAETGVKARLTTTTKVGIDEFNGTPVTLVQNPADLARALSSDARVMLIVGGTLPEKAKYTGVDPRMLERLSLGADTVLLVEGDGSRNHPMKAPESREPVIPMHTSTVFALMGACAFDEPIDDAHCFNYQKTLALVGKTGSFFEPPEIAALAADPEGSCKGVLSGMAFRLLMNQGDLEEKRATASEALRLARDKYGIRGALVSFQKGELYDTTDE
jgi:probable selenium-dependent hydroxylase accessory protein YqeC